MLTSFRPFYGGLVGFKGSTKHRIESETQTELFIPRPRETDDVCIKGFFLSIKYTLFHNRVILQGKSRKSVCAAKRKIELMVISLRKRTNPTHFTCIPVCKDNVKQRYMEFKVYFKNGVHFLFVIIIIFKVISTR